MLLKRPLFVAITLAIAAAAPAAHAQSFAADTPVTTTTIAAPAAVPERIRHGIQATRVALDPSTSPEERHRQSLAAREILSAPAESGDPLAAWHLGCLLVAGMASAEDVTHGIRLIQIAADQGHAAAAFWMAQHPQSPAHHRPKARIRYLERAAFAGHVSAMNLLAAHFAHQAIDARDHADRRIAEIHRRFWLEKESEHAGTLRPVIGRPSPIDSDDPSTKVAAPTVQRAPDEQVVTVAAPAERSSSPASHRAQHRPVPAVRADGGSDRHRDHGLPRHEPAASCAHDDRTFQLPGVSYEPSSRCTDADTAGNGTVEKLSATDMNLLGLQHYARGDYGDAAAWFHRAARAGHPAGMTNFALLLLYGRGIDQDARRAVKLLHKAEALDNAVAALNLGQLHARGAFVERNDELALRFFRRAEQLGSDTARSARIDLMRRTGLR